MAKFGGKEKPEFKSKFGKSGGEIGKSKPFGKTDKGEKKSVSGRKKY